MLVVLRVRPVASPLEAVLPEEPEAEVALRDLVSEIRFAVRIRRSVCRFDDQYAVIINSRASSPDRESLRSVQRGDVYRYPQTGL